MNRRFQLDLLVGRRVYDAEGRKLGRVDEIVLIRRGDLYEVEGLLIGANSLLERLGVSRAAERFRRRLNLPSWGNGSNIINWEQIDSIEEKAICLKVPRERIRTMEPNSEDGNDPGRRRG
jgi:sporulation protein YlmC with PRC-barrel domain